MGFQHVAPLLSVIQTMCRIGLIIIVVGVIFIVVGVWALLNHQFELLLTGIMVINATCLSADNCE